MIPEARGTENIGTLPDRMVSMHAVALIASLALAASGPPPAAPAQSAPTPAAPAPAAAAPAALPAGPAEAGWRAARFGMTPEEVVAAFGGEARLLQPPMKLADGNVVAVGIDGYPFEGLTTDVRFVFEDGKLVLVSLRTPQKVYVDAEAYIRVRDALARAWGPPAGETADANFIDMRQARWDRGTTRSDLKYIPGVVALVHYPRPR